MKHLFVYALPLQAEIFRDGKLPRPLLDSLVMTKIPVPAMAPWERIDLWLEVKQYRDCDYGVYWEEDESAAWKKARKWAQSKYQGDFWDHRDTNVAYRPEASVIFETQDCGLCVQN